MARISFDTSGANPVYKRPEVSLEEQLVRASHQRISCRLVVCLMNPFRGLGDAGACEGVAQGGGVGGDRGGVLEEGCSLTARSKGLKALAKSRLRIPLPGGGGLPKEGAVTLSNARLEGEV